MAALFSLNNEHPAEPVFCLALMLLLGWGLQWRPSGPKRSGPVPDNRILEDTANLQMLGPALACALITKLVVRSSSGRPVRAHSKRCNLQVMHTQKKLPKTKRADHHQFDFRNASPARATRGSEIRIIFRLERLSHCWRRGALYGAQRRSVGATKKKSQRPAKQKDFQSAHLQNTMCKANQTQLRMKRKLVRRDREFAMSLISKLNVVAFRNRIIRRSLHSVDCRMERKAKPLDENSDMETKATSRDACLSEDFEFFDQDNVLQQEWDALFESAFEAVDKASVEIFESN